MISEFLFCVGN